MHMTPGAGLRMRFTHRIRWERVRGEWFGRLTDKMASIRRTDIMHRSFSKGRPAKTERERNKRRQEAYRWRDARRIYLANSFDKWRKLRSSLGLKDSGLAWHLMEAHEKGQCGICRRNKDDQRPELKSLRSVPQVQEFLPSVISSLRNLCYSHFQFEDCIKIVGLLCLEFDNTRKENFSVNETLVAKSLSKSDSKDQSKSHTEVFPSSLSYQKNDLIMCQNTSLKMTVEESISVQNVTDETISETSAGILPLKVKATEKEDSVSALTNCQQSSTNGQSITKFANPLLTPEATFQLPLQVPCFSSKDESENTDVTICNANNNVSVSTPGMDVNRDKQASEKNMHIKVNVEEETLPCPLNSQIDLSLGDQSSDWSLQNRDRHSAKPIMSVEFLHQSISRNELPISSPSVISTDVPNPELEVETKLKNKNTSLRDTTVELPLDMSLIKAEPLKYETALASVSSSENQPAVFTCPKVKRKEATENLQADVLGLPPPREEAFSKGRCRTKEESSPSIPWQRRDMSRKEEYEFLEMNPFSDLAEFSLKYPHVHQRTYYRWKRRIKEEYIILEQCPDMTFEQFSSVVLQAKETVFNLWKGFIAQGRGFFAPSADAPPKKVETKFSTAKSVNNFSAEYTHLQKNLFITQEQFCRKYPNISADIFNVLKRKVMQEFWLFFHNKQMSWKEFSKILNVSEDVYNYWREYAESIRLNTLSPEMKAALGDFSPNSQMFSSSFSPFLESPPSPSDTSLQVSKEGTQKSAMDSINNQNLQLDSALKDSVSRSLSASYLNSLQNMMIPWASYYNIAPPLGQQMLPMMLWPRMLGYASGLGGAVNISSLISASSSTTSASSVNPPIDVLSNASRETFSPHSIKDYAKNDSENFLLPKIDPRPPKLHSAKRPSPDDIQEHDSVHENDGIKKQRVKEDWEGGSNPYSRSRKQNKQEYIYYLKNPELCFKDLETLFPAISVRTFYRWRKEMNAAILFIEDNKDLTYQQFKLVFPDIPEDIFDNWKLRSEKMSTSKSILCNTDPASEEYIYATAKSCESESDKNVNRSEDYESCLPEDIGLNQKKEIADELPFRGHSCSVYRESTQAREIDEGAELYSHQNPDVDFAIFAQMFPEVSSETFYRWKKQWKDGTDFVHANPDVSFESYKSIDASISKEIFHAWKIHIFAKEKHGEAKDCIASGESKRDFKTNGHCNRKHNGPEFAYLQLNPYTDFSQFTQVYPDVPSRTFYRWKREIQQILSYVRTQPATTFSDISAVLPDVSEEAFLKWRELIEQETRTSDIIESKEYKEYATETCNSVDEETKNKMTKALLHLMHNPNMAYKDFRQMFDFVSPETFQLWLHRVKLVVLHISSNPDLNYAEFSSAITDIGEDVFKRWKNLTPEEISSIGTQSQDYINTSGNFENPEKSKDMKDAIIFCQKFPAVTYDLFSCQFPSISKSLFKQWMLKISDQIAFIKDNPGLTFHDFNKVFEDVGETVFESWKERPFPQEANGPLTRPVSSEMKTILSTPQGQFDEDRIPHKFGDEEIFVKDESKSSQAKDIISNTDPIETSLIASQAPSSVQSQICHGKENEDISVESSLSKLTKFAESDVSLYTRWVHGNPSEQEKPTEHVTAFSQNRNSPSLEALPKSLVENDIDNNNVHANGLYNSSLSRSTNIADNVNKLLHPLSTNVSRKELPECTMKYENDVTEDCDITGQNGLSEKKSLSALMIKSTNKAQLSFPSSNFKDGNVHTKSSHSSHSGSWNPSQVNSKEDDEIFSSQRQKKMSRAEYLFVKDNPDVDSQEFARIFPGVSARTFYRWKKEIKAQIQIQ